MSDTIDQDRAYTFVLGGNVRILVMDDDPIQCEFARVYLSTPTAEVETAENGEDGLRLLKAEKFDLAVVDLDMPVMNGFQVIRSIRNDPELRNLPIVIVTGREDVESIDRAYDEGATSFVTKPVNWRLLSYQLRYVLRAQRMAAA
ncbi:MAG: response regulator [Beijerinckiaceae bacterium]